MDGPAVDTGRQLWILRHAKAATGAPGGGRDRDRPLTGRGRRDATALGIRLAARSAPFDRAELVPPTVALVSAAARTVETAALVTGALGDRVRIDTFQSLYSAEPDTVLAYVREVEGPPGSVLVVGHNPTVSHLASDLLEPGSPGRVQLGSTGLVTCALAVVDLGPGAWQDVSTGSGRLVGLFAPPY
jgi:phosphohistidine phosphatase